MARGRSSRTQIPLPPGLVQRPRQQAQPKKKSHPGKKSGKKGKKGGRPTLRMALDARVPIHAPPPVPLGPYTVVRDRSTISISSDATYDQVFVFGSFSLPNSANASSTIGSVSNVGDPVTPMIGAYGKSNAVPGGIDELSLVSAAASAAALEGASFALHSLTVSVTCVGSATSAAGSVVFGTGASRIPRKSFSTYQGLIDSLSLRPDAVMHSTYSLLGQEQVRVAYPLDVTEWSLQNCGTVSNDNSKCSMNDRLAPVYLIIRKGAAVPYHITVHTEWRVNYVSAALQSTATPHAMTSPTLWQSIINSARTAGGAFNIATSAVAGAAGAIMGSRIRFRAGPRVIAPLL